MSSDHQEEIPEDKEDAYQIRANAGDFRNPWCVYLYYLGEQDSVGRRPVRHYYRAFNNQIPRAELESVVVELARNARRHDSSPPPIGADWRYMVWDRISYLVVVVDDPAVVLDPKAIVFTQKHDAQPNHSFFDAQNAIINIAEPGESARRVPVVSCINHMKMNANGDPQVGPRKHHFDLYGSNLPLPDLKLEYPDSGGTNMGPPVGPP